jgi:hypothetical protein
VETVLQVDHEGVLAALKAAERKIADGRVHMARQREIIALLASGGHDTRLAEVVLASFKQTHLAQIAIRDQLRRELVSHFADE